MRIPITVILLTLMFSDLASPSHGSYRQVKSPEAETHHIYLPLIQVPKKYFPRVNAPSFDGDVRFSETAIFWFGRVNPIDNYADVRVGYNADELYVHVAAFDRRLWYDAEPSPADLTAWDAVSLYLSLGGDTGDVLGPGAYRFDAQFSSWEARDNKWQAGYRGDGSGWAIDPVSFTTTSGWRGNAPNDNTDDRGWSTTFHIPFGSLGLSNPPMEGTLWGLAISLHDRDDAAGTPISVKTWPEGIQTSRPKTWGQLRFGPPTYSSPTTNSSNTTIIRQGLNGAQVIDAHVGGHTTCGQDYNPDFFNGWGDANYAGYDQINIQNQADVADWPCFSKFFITFPLDLIPPGKAILSAKLKMFLFGNSGQGWQPAPQPSLIQVFTVKDDWGESTITWNNAPLALENVSRAWVYPVESFPDYPGIAYEWDVSRVVNEAYQSGQLLRLVLYSADGAIHSGKYFYSSDIGDWNAEGRPTLTVVWGGP